MESFRKVVGKKVSATGSAKNDSRQLYIDMTGRFPTLKEAELYLVQEAMNRAGGNQGIAASLLGITRQALNKRLNKSDS